MMRTAKNRRSLILLASTSLVARAMVSAPVTLDYQLDKPILKVARANSRCFAAGTRALMANGAAKDGVRASFFGGLNQVGADLSPGQEADAIDGGWQ